MRTQALSVSALVTTALLATAFASHANAGVYLESTESEPGSKTPPKVGKMWFDGGRMRGEEASAGGNVMIFKSRALYTLDPKTQSYRVMDQAQMEQMGAKLAAARKQMEAKMAAMPPERRAMVEKMMGQAGGGADAPKRVLKNTGRTETVAGVRCSVWEVSYNGKKDEELCAAAPGALPGGDEVTKTLREIGEMMKGFVQSMSAGRGDKATSVWRDLETIKGYPILSRDFSADGKVTSETRLTVAKSQSVPAAQFEVPAGYKEKKVAFGPGASSDGD
jgi:hypothetical protein